MIPKLHALQITSLSLAMAAVLFGTISIWGRSACWLREYCGEEFAGAFLITAISGALAFVCGSTATPLSFFAAKKYRMSRGMEKHTVEHFNVFMILAWILYGIFVVASICMAGVTVAHERESIDMF